MVTMFDISWTHLWDVAELNRLLSNLQASILFCSSEELSTRAKEVPAVVSMD